MAGKYHVLLGSRSLAKAEKAIQTMNEDTSEQSDTNNIEPIQIDVTSDESIEKAAQTVQSKFGYLDVLMNNAGISRAVGVHDDTKPNEDGSGPSLREQYRQQYDTNVFGAVVVTEAFLPLLRKSIKLSGKRIVFTGSGTASLKLAAEENGPLNGKYYRLYRSTKTALNMVMVSYARELEDEGIVVGASNPGYCATNLNLHRGLKDPRDGAKVLVRSVTVPNEEIHAKLINEEGSPPW